MWGGGACACVCVGGGGGRDGNAGVIVEAVLALAHPIACVLDGLVRCAAASQDTRGVSATATSVAARRWRSQKFRGQWPLRLIRQAALCEVVHGGREKAAVTAHRHPDLLGAVQQDLNGDGAARHFLPAEKTGLNSRAWGERTTSGHAALRAILMRSEIAETGAKAQQAPQYTCAAHSRGSAF